MEWYCIPDSFISLYLYCVIDTKHNGWITTVEFNNKTRRKMVPVFSCF